jgi:glycerate dehydrogenase
MDIVVLDAKPLDAGDLDWSVFDSFGVPTLYDNTREVELIERISEAEIIFSNKVKIPRAALEAAPNLTMIGVLATGYDIIDIEAAREKNIVVCNVPSYSSTFTSQSTWALILELTHHAGEHNWSVKSGAWSHQEYFSFWNFPLVELDGKTLLIVGLGKIGRYVAQIGRAMGMQVLAAQLPGREAKTDAEFSYVPLDEAIESADVISLHCPATPQTRGLINAERLSKMKAGTLLVNASRGTLVEEESLAAALRENRIAGYAADVLSQEPPLETNPLLNAPNCILTPHLSWASIECRRRILQTSVENLRAFLEGKPQNVVS